MSVLQRLTSASSFGVASAITLLAVGGAVSFSAVAPGDSAAGGSAPLASWTLRGALDPLRAAKPSPVSAMVAKPDIVRQRPSLSTLHVGAKQA